MPRFYEVSDNFTKFGFAIVSVVNSFLIYLTLFNVKRITGTYKQMLIVVAVSGILFAACELVARPFVHSYNSGWLFFSLNTWIQNQLIVQIALAVYASFYLLMMSFISVQFLFRYFTLISVGKVKQFEGKGVILWITYPIICGACYGGPLFIFGLPDDFGDEYFGKVMLESYELAIRDVPRFPIITYDPEGSLKKGAFFVLSGAIVMILQYVIIIYCGIRMHLFMKREFKNTSIPNKKLQKQFFRTLVVQTVIPTILFVCPAAGVLMSPFLNIEMNFQTGWIYAALSLYPPMDSIALMFLVTEYRKIIKGFWKASTPCQPTTVTELELRSSS